MSSFIEVPAQAIESHLAAKRFARTVQREEVVYVRASQRNPDVKIKVYTSIRAGRTVVRGAGKDAVRVCVVFDNGRRSFGIGKFPAIPRVHSVESVLRRTDERLKSAMLRAVEWLNQNGAPAVPAELERLADKAAYAAAERADEEAGFMSDPDMQEAFAREDREDGHDEPPPPEQVDDFSPRSRLCGRCQTVTCPDGCCCAC